MMNTFDTTMQQKRRPGQTQGANLGQYGGAGGYGTQFGTTQYGGGYGGQQFDTAQGKTDMGGGIDRLPAQVWGQQDGTEYFQNWLNTRYGRRATGDEMSAIAKGIGYGGGDISSDLMSRAQTYADDWAKRAGIPIKNAAGTQSGIPQTRESEVDPNRAALQARIAQMLGANTGDVDTTTKEYQSQLGSFQRGQQRGIEAAKRAAAARAAGGQGSGASESEYQGIDTTAANAQGNFEAQLASQQIGRQREDLQNAMGLAQQAGLANESQRLQERLANLDANFRQQGLNLQGELGRGDLDLRRYLGRGQLGLGYLNAMLSDRQANNALGFNYADLQNRMNQGWLQQLLGGL